MIRVMVFSRVPEPGQVKSRLVPALGPAGAARLQGHLTRNAVRTAVAAHVGPVELWCTPTTEHPFLAALEEELPVQLRLQGAGDLGERMAAAFDDALSGSSGALLMGSDCLDLTPGDLRTAVDALGSGADVVLGPAADGGYVLIGLRHTVPELFQGMPWGTSEVLRLTRERLTVSGKDWYELPVRHDVDRPEDLDRFAELQRWTAGPEAEATTGRRERPAPV
ncbi:MAG: TIGR04282 family arsenosugar biosynthesis glycosyltransferase [Gammaproteobacteria bacterium]|nr:TIGR04282 family arsenosugar biosynthesis glycosyltransferase [Gammaproteobacteria bacterium]